MQASRTLLTNFRTKLVWSDVDRTQRAESLMRGSLIAAFAAAYHIANGGTVEESAKSLASVVAMVPLMLLIMLTVLMFELRSFQRLFLVLTVGPLGLIGVVAALLVSGWPLGFVAILGILAA